jgi:D-alanine-D-alanine ligase
VHTICPARVSKRVAQKVAQVCLRAYRVCGCRDYARLDVRLKGAQPFVLEVNPNPDLTEGVSFMESAEHAGYPFAKALRRIVEMALARG